MNPIKVTPQPFTPPLPAVGKPGIGTDEKESFGDFLSEAIQDVNSLQQQSGEAQDKLVRGDAAELHQVMIAAEKAGISFDLLLEVRRRLLEAYQNIITMPM